MTPTLVGLAGDMEGKPFHLIATHRQNNPKEEVVAYIKSQKLPADTPNFTVSSFGGHPKIKGNGYVPYYMIFDHTGRLARHHMGGPYHGGDGTKAVEIVEDLVAKTPAIYTGREPFQQLAGLADRVANRKKLAAAVQEIEERLAAGGDDAAAELERLREAVVRFRDRGLAAAKRALATAPDTVVDRLEALVKDLEDTPYVQAVKDELERLDGSRELKDAIVVQKLLDKTRKVLDKLKPCKTCKRAGHPAHNAACADCGRQNGGMLKTLAGRIEQLLEGKDDLPIAQTAKTLLADLRGE